MLATLRHHRPRAFEHPVTPLRRIWTDSVMTTRWWRASFAMDQWKSCDANRTKSCGYPVAMWWPIAVARTRAPALFAAIEGARMTFAVAPTGDMGKGYLADAVPQVTMTENPVADDMDHLPFLLHHPPHADHQCGLAAGALLLEAMTPDDAGDDVGLVLDGEQHPSPRSGDCRDAKQKARAAKAGAWSTSSGSRLANLFPTGSRQTLRSTALGPIQTVAGARQGSEPLAGSGPVTARRGRQEDRSSCRHPIRARGLLQGHHVIVRTLQPSRIDAAARTTKWLGGSS